MSNLEWIGPNGGRENMRIDVRDKSIVIDDAEIKFPIALEELEAVLGQPDETVQEDENEVLYIYHELGMVFEARVNDRKWFKYRKIEADDAHNIIGIKLYYGESVKPMFHEKSLPTHSCNVQITQNGRNLWFISDRAQTEDFRMICWTEYGCSLNGQVEQIDAPLSISYEPKRTREPANYKIKKCKEEALEFENFNFKLAVVQVLMYDLEVLEPYFDIDDFAMQYEGKEIDTESFKISRPVVNYFKKLSIPKKFAELVEEIDMDGGNEIYANIFPMWDGEDELFDLDAVTEVELKQFPNLKKATIMSEKFEEVSKTFVKLGIEVEQL